MFKIFIFISILLSIGSVAIYFNKKNKDIARFELINLLVNTLIFLFFMLQIIAIAYLILKYYNADIECLCLTIIAILIFFIILLFSFFKMNLITEKSKDIKHSSSRKLIVKFIINHVIIGFVYLIAFTILFISDWGAQTFAVDIEAIIFTLMNPIKGANNDVVKEAVLYCVPRILFVALLYVVYVIFDYRRKFSLNLNLKSTKSKFNIDLIAVSKVFVSIGCVIMLILSIFYVDRNFGLFEFIKNRMHKTYIYEEYYVNPHDVNIRLINENGKKKNLIYVYMESMETTYTSVQNGGNQETCYIPNLVELANENISFSNSDKLGGFISTTGTTWTMGSLLATSSGIPFNFPVNGNSMYQRETFSSNLVTLGDVLDDFGYSQTFLCGSDSEYGGRKSYFTTHGKYEIIDLFTAREKGYIDPDYQVWWGYEDKYLYEIAKNEILEKAKQDQPFNFTMLTVDTHHQDGYECDLCNNNYSNVTANVVSCADKQIYEFVQWCKAQDFYNDTVIIITGDHPRMDKNLIGDLTYNERPVYNCFINCEIQSLFDYKNRTFTAMDMFPTVLYALGYEWDGNRLGLGTNLFSNQNTLAEELGLDYLSVEFKKTSNFYRENFY